MMSAIILKRYQSSSPHTKIRCKSVYANNTDYEVLSSCVVQKNRAGELLLCEAVKVDDSLSDADLKKNARNTISLLMVLFEDPSEAQNWYDDISKKNVWFRRTNFQYDILVQQYK